ncbi:SDR family oxidoreductase [Niveispirillum fermenti]|uniref:SDR family oxidoreductase n=1 Tax=Niveispirillum fermenti TaxID=1233113 RepID=UPI003A88BA34
MTGPGPTFSAGLFRGRTAMVAGGTSGINLAIARRLGELGAAVHVFSRDPARVAAAIGSLAEVCDASGSVADVRDFDAVTAAVGAGAERLGNIDILVSGAAGNFLARAADMSAKGFRTVIDIDLVGGFHVMKAAYPHLRRPGASVINISALHAFTAFAAQAHVCAAKAGLDAMIRALALEWGQEGIRLNSIAPGAVSDTEGMARIAPTAADRERFTRDTPLGRWTTKAEIADVAVFLASAAAASITGTVMVVDGGYMAGRTGNAGGRA